MKIQEQALLSGLVFADSKDKIEPHWRPSDENWSPLFGRHVWGHGLLVVPHPNMIHDKMVVLLGGCPGSSVTNLVRLLKVGENRWQNATPLQEKRVDLASVVCNGAVYAIGGYNGHNALDTIERIHVDDLLHSSLSSSSKNSSKGWKMLKCRLTSERFTCAAITVSDRFIVVAGGYVSIFDNVLSSVEILDTASGNPYSFISGPSLKEARRGLAMAVVASRIYAVGGWDGIITYGDCRKSVEYLEFGDWLDPVTSTVALSTKSWTIHTKLILNLPRAGFSAVQVGSCLVVAGGFTDRYEDVHSVEVLDTVRNVVWKLPDLTISKVRNGCGMISLSNGLAVISRNDEMELSCETLSLVDMKSWLFARLLEMGKVPVSAGQSC